MHFMAWAATSGAIAKLRIGSSIPHLTGVRLKTLDVVWPEPKVQASVAAFLDAAKTEVASMVVAQSENERTLAGLEQATLAEAFRGEL